MAGKTVIIIGGPTAVGKTPVAIELARHFHTGIISADSRQCFRELNIGVARPSPEELSMVTHHFIASHSIHDRINAAYFESYALKKAEEIFAAKDHLVMVGGTGLYLRAFSEGMDEIPEVPEEVHNGIIEQYRKNGLTWLQEQIRRHDPVYAEKGEMQNPQRLMRAYEVWKATGQSILSFRKGKTKERPFRLIRIALELPREALYANINGRVDRMMEMGLLAEVRSLLPYQHLNSLQTVGYRELVDYFNGGVSLQEAVEEVKKNTRRYAKRQLTWFRKDDTYRWFFPHDVEGMLRFIDSH